MIYTLAKRATAVKFPRQTKKKIKNKMKTFWNKIDTLFASTET